MSKKEESKDLIDRTIKSIETKLLLDNNCLIAKFMGGELDRYRTYVNWGIDTPQNGSNQHSVFDLQYHCNWSWIMLVVEKIEKIKLPSPSLINVSVEIKRNSCRIFKGEWNDDKEGFISVVSYPNNNEQFTKIGATYKAICLFIEWYNTNSK